MISSDVLRLSLNKRMMGFRSPMPITVSTCRPTNHKGSNTLNGTGDGTYSEDTGGFAQFHGIGVNDPFLA